MTDVILVTTIVVFFGLAALLVRALGHVVTDSTDMAGAEDLASKEMAPGDASTPENAGTASNTGSAPRRPQ